MAYYVNIMRKLIERLSDLIGEMAMQNGASSIVDSLQKAFKEALANFCGRYTILRFVSYVHNFCNKNLNIRL